MFRSLAHTAFALCLLAATAIGGIRGPGPYAGTVIYDQWDTCYIYSGSYVMYIAGKEKERLRKYAGRSILIDATEVNQPMNPGDGLITEFKYIGPAEVKENLPQVDGLRLDVRQILETPKRLRLELRIENQSARIVGVETSEIAPTLFGERFEDDVFSPSDGKSDAKITRCNLEDANRWRNEQRLTSKDSNVKPIKLTRKFSVQVEDIHSLPKSFQLAAGEKRLFVISLGVPPGKYDFLFGYGGGVHEGKGLASNVISFSVDERGQPAPIPRNAEVPRAFDNSYWFASLLAADDR
jgi:hypothetical protein